MRAGIVCAIKKLADSYSGAQLYTHDWLTGIAGLLERCRWSNDQGFNGRAAAA